MDRRRFIEVSGAGSLAISTDPAAVLPNSAAAAGSSPEIDIDRYLAVVDESLERIARADMFRHAPTFPTDAPERKLAADAVRALYFSAMMADLPIKAQADERVQARLWQMAPEIDASVAEMTRYVETRTSSQWADLQLALRHRRNPAMEISEVLADEAALAGMSARRRRHTRMLLTHVSTRLRTQPAELVVAEYLEKAKRIAESDVFDDLARRKLAAQASELAFWHAHDQTPRGKTPSGLRTLGWGVAIAAGGLLLALAGGEGVGVIGVIGLTVGVILILIGLIQLLVNAAR